MVNDARRLDFNSNANEGEAEDEDCPESPMLLRRRSKMFRVGLLLVSVLLSVMVC
jgi:hypothetical protein